MRLIDNQNNFDPIINLALEEYCYRNLDDLHEYILFYINKPSIIIGNHQNAFQEFDLQFATRQQIHPYRRISGGGTVYHDFGNLNFSFITAFSGDMQSEFRTRLQPIVQTLQRLGVPAKLVEKNNIIVHGKKISGNSQHTNLRRLLSHGTLLLDARLDILQHVLVSKLDIVHSRAIKSIPSPVANIADYLSRPMKMETFMGTLQGGISTYFGGLRNYLLKPEQWDAVYRLAKEKYGSWTWVFGRSPAFTARHKVKISSENIEVYVAVKKGIIRDIKSAGDHPENSAIRKDLAKLVGGRYGSELANQLLE